MHDIRNPAYVFFGTLAAAFLLCDLHLAAQALPKDSTSPTTGVKPPAPSFWEDFYWKAWPKEAAGQVSCSGTPHNGRPHAELTVIAPTKRVATGWVVATDSIDRVVF
jgi:hypothetical protein